VAVNKDKESESHLLSALLTGVNRVHPYLPEQNKDLEQRIDSLCRVVHTGPPSVSTQLLFHVANGMQQDHVSAKAASRDSTARQDRFYRVLYATLSQPFHDC